MKADESSETDKLLQQDLHERGWTLTMIRGLAPEPETYARRGGGHYCLFPRDKIEAIEATEEWKTAKEKSTKSKERARRSVQTKVSKLLVTVEQSKLDLRVPAQPLRAAIESYNGWQTYHRDAGRWTTIKDSPEFLRRIVGNFLRHECSNYEQILFDARGRCGVGEAYMALRRRIDAEVDAAVDRIFAHHRGVPCSAGEEGLTNAHG